MAPYATLPLAEYTPRVQTRCHLVVRSVGLVLAVIRTVLEVSEEVYNSLTGAQNGELVAELEQRHTTAVVLLTKLMLGLLVCGLNCNKRTQYDDKP